MRPPVAGVEDEHVGLLPPAGRLVDAVDVEDGVGVLLPVEAHSFADQEMRPHEFHGAVVVLRMFMALPDFTSSSICRPFNYKLQELAEHLDVDE